MRNLRFDQGVSGDADLLLPLFLPFLDKLLAGALVKSDLLRGDAPGAGLLGVDIESERVEQQSEPPTLLTPD